MAGVVLGETQSVKGSGRSSTGMTQNESGNRHSDISQLVLNPGSIFRWQSLQPFWQRGSPNRLGY